MPGALRLSIFVVLTLVASLTVMVGRGYYTSFKVKRLCATVDPGLSEKQLEQKVTGAGFRWVKPRRISAFRPELTLTAFHSLLPCTCMVQLDRAVVSHRQLQCL